MIIRVAGQLKPLARDIPPTSRHRLRTNSSRVLSTRHHSNRKSKKRSRRVATTSEKAPPRRHHREGTTMAECPPSAFPVYPVIATRRRSLGFHIDHGCSRRVHWYKLLNTLLPSADPVRRHLSPIYKPTVCARACMNLNECMYVYAYMYAYMYAYAYVYVEWKLMAAPMAVTLGFIVLLHRI